MNRGRFQKQTKSKKKLHIILSLIIGINMLLAAALFLFEAGRKVGENSQPASMEDFSSLQNIVVDTVVEEPVEPESTVAVELTEPKTVAAITNPTEAITETTSTAPTIETTALPEKIGTVLRSAGELSIRSGPGTNYGIAGRLNGGDSVTVYEERVQDNVHWGNIGYGWICMDYIVFGEDNSTLPNERIQVFDVLEYVGEWLDNSKTYTMTIRQEGNIYRISAANYNGSNVTATWEMSGTVDNNLVICYYDSTCTDKNVNGYDIVRYINKEGHIYYNSKYNQLEWWPLKSDTDPIVFTRIGAHTTMPSSDTYTDTGYVVNADGGLNVRQMPSASSNIVRRLYTGDRVTVLEQTYSEGMEWGRISDGWICLAYFSASATTSASASADVVVGTVKAGMDALNVRSGPGTSFDAVARIPGGGTVKIYETKNVNGTDWGRIDSGWVCMDYIVFGEVNSVAPTDSGLIIISGGNQPLSSSTPVPTFGESGNQQQSTSTPASTSGGIGMKWFPYTSKEYSEFALRECKIELGGGSSIKITNVTGNPSNNYKSIWITGQGTMGEKRFSFSMHADGSSGRLILTKLGRI